MQYPVPAHLLRIEYVREGRFQTSQLTNLLKELIGCLLRVLVRPIRTMQCILVATYRTRVYPAETYLFTRRLVNTDIKHHIPSFYFPNIRFPWPRHVAEHVVKFLPLHSPFPIENDIRKDVQM